MQQQKEQITRSTISYRNKRAKEQIQHILQLAERITSDVEKEKRESMHLCLCCYYARSQRIGGAAITSKPCGVCEETMQFGSTATDAGNRGYVNSAEQTLNWRKEESRTLLRMR